MNKLGFVVLAVIGSVALVGCGDEEGEGARAARVNVSAARSRFTGGPTAALTGANAGKAVSETKRQQASGDSAMKANPLGGSSSGAGSSTRSLGPRSIKLLDLDGTGAELACADIEADKEQGSCPCPGGGDLAYDIPNVSAMKGASDDALPDEVSIGFNYAACVLDGVTYDGSLGMLLSKKSVVKASSASTNTTAGGDGSNMLIVADDLVVDGEKLDFAFAIENGTLFYAPEVAGDGSYVLSELSFTGETKIHATNGTFACELDAEGAGECVGEDGDAITVEPDGAAPGNDAKEDEDAGIGDDE